MGSAVNPDLERRMRVLRLRQRVEATGWAVYDASLGARPSGARCAVAGRYGLLAGWAAGPEEFLRYRAVAAELSWIYGQCCDVLHGRRAFVDLPEPVVTGWEERVRSSEQIIEQVIGPMGEVPTW